MYWVKTPCFQLALAVRSNKDDADILRDAQTELAANWKPPLSIGNLAVFFHPKTIACLEVHDEIGHYADEFAHGKFPYRTYRQKNCLSW